MEETSTSLPPIPNTQIRRHSAASRSSLTTQGPEFSRNATNLEDIYKYAPKPPPPEEKRQQSILSPEKKTRSKFKNAVKDVILSGINEKAGAGIRSTVAVPSALRSRGGDSRKVDGSIAGTEDDYDDTKSRKTTGRSRVASLVGLVLFRKMYEAELNAHVNSKYKDSEVQTTIIDEEVDSDDDEEFAGPCYSQEAELAILRCYDEVLRKKLANAYPRYRNNLRPTATPTRASLVSARRRYNMNGKRLNDSQNGFFITELKNGQNGQDNQENAQSTQKQSARPRSKMKRGDSKKSRSRKQSAVSKGEKSVAGEPGWQPAQHPAVRLMTRQRIGRAGTLLDFLKKDLGEAAVTNARCITPLKPATEPPKRCRPRPRSRALIREYNTWSNTWA